MRSDVTFKYSLQFDTLSFSIPYFVFVIVKLLATNSSSQCVESFPSTYYSPLMDMLKFTLLFLDTL